MNTELTVLTPSEVGEPRLDAMTDAELLEFFSRCALTSAVGIVLAGKALKVMIDRGIDVSKIQSSIRNTLEDLASGHLLSEAFLRFYVFPSLLQIMRRMPLDTQKELANGAPVELLEYKGEVPDFSLQDPKALTPAQLKQVFGNKRIRTRAEQHTYLTDIKTKKAMPVPSEVGKLKIDKTRGGVVHRGELIVLADLVAAVKALRA